MGYLGGFGTGYHGVSLWLLLAAWLVCLGAIGCSLGSGPALVEPGDTPSVAPTFIQGSPIAVPAASISLNGEWRFAVDVRNLGEKEGWEQPSLDDAAWTTVTAPHTWNVMEKYHDYSGLAWYRKSVFIPEAARGGHLRLHFEAVFYRARVWLNGRYLGQHDGGYTPFEFDVTSVARAGQENLIAVQVDNRRAQDRIPANLYSSWTFDWWNYGGLVRSASLEITSPVYIAGQQLVAVPHLTGEDQADTATVTATVTLSNTSSEPFDGVVAVDILRDADGSTALDAPLTASMHLSPGQAGAVQVVAQLSDPDLWHFDHPSLYRCSTSLRSFQGELMHSTGESFGIRRVEIKDARFYLNGEPVRLVGLTRHADSPACGLAETTTVMAADYDDLKRLNMVLSRPVHYPQDRFILDYCDRNGILLIPEVPAWQLTAAQMDDPQMRALEQQQLREMITSALNHPSIWAWSVGNEIESETEAGHRFVGDMVAYAKSLDPTRPVGFASNRLGQDPAADATALSDFVLMNQYFGTWVGPKQGLDPALDSIHQAWPDRVVIISEYGFEPRWNGLGGPREPDPDSYYASPPGAAASSDAADQVRRRLIAEQMATFRRKPFIVGAIFWTYQDYRTPTWFKMGIVDEERGRRGSWAVLREEYSPILVSSATIGRAGATIEFKTRGPLEQDMPVYTLRGYRLHWEVVNRDGSTVLAEGELSLPTLPPTSSWVARMEWTVPEDDFILQFAILRPTGFAVVERAYNAQGELVSP